MSKYSDALKNRVKKNQENRGNSGGGFLNLTEFDGIEYFKAKEGRNTIFILPYLVSTKHHPQGIKEGEPDYLLDINVHRGIGVANESVICPKRTFKKPCPICEEMERLKEEDPDSTVAEGLKPSRRVVYNILDRRDTEKGIQLFTSSYYFFEKELLDASSNSDLGEGIIPFSDPDAGYAIKFRAVEETFKKNKFFKFKDFTFEKTEETFDKNLIEKTLPLDKLMVIKTYEEIERIFYGNADDEDEKDSEEEKSASTRPETKEKSSPIIRSKKYEEDEEDEKPVKKTEKENSKSSDGCPHDHVFGKDCDEFKECHKCSVWEACADKHSEMKKKSKG